MENKLTVTAVITNKCNFNCDYCVAGGPKDDGPEINFDVLLKWLDKYTSGCNLHISGGEPLMIVGIIDSISKCVEAGHDVTIFTNGSLFSQHPNMLGLPVTWHVTHHASHLSIDRFLDAINFIKDKKHLICRIRNDQEGLNKKEETEALYSEFNFRWILPYNGYFGYVKPFDSSPVCENIIMIGTDGTVFPCSTTRGETFGNIHDMTFDAEAARRFECICGKDKRRCQAMQSAEIMEGL